MNQKAIIFDIDGTLLGLHQPDDRAFTRAFDICFGLTGINDDWTSYPVHTDIALAKHILNQRLDRPSKDLDYQQIMSCYYRNLKEETYKAGYIPVLIPGARPLLDYLQARNEIGLALATGNSREIARLRMAQAGIGHYFQIGGFAEDGEIKTLILKKAIADCRTRWPELRASDILYIGDSEGDIEAAESNSVHFIQISSERSPSQVHRFPVYSHFLELDEFIAEVCRILNFSQSL